VVIAQSVQFACGQRATDFVVVVVVIVVVLRQMIL
jgi:hypothetical protein